MNEDPTRAMPRDPRVPSHGSLGPADPSADPATHPALPPVPPLPSRGQTGESPTVPTPGLPTPGLPTPGLPTPGLPTPGLPAGTGEPEPREPGTKRSRSGVLWVGVILSAFVLLFLLIFILQNNEPVLISFLGVSGTLPTGVALLFAAVAGLLLGAIPGSLRILQLRRAARRAPR
jgi:uncharacterized integral membrane protein